MKLRLKISICAFLVSMSLSTFSFADKGATPEAESVIATVKDQKILESDFSPFVDDYFKRETDLSEIQTQDLMFLLYSYFGQQKLAELAIEKGLGDSEEAREQYQLMADLELAREVQINQEILADLAKLDDNLDQEVSLPLLVVMKEVLSERKLYGDEKELEEAELKYLTLEYLKVAKLVEIAKEQGLDQNEIFINQMKFHHQRYLSELYKRDYEDHLQFTDAELEEIYQKWLAEQDHHYYKLAHIYVEDEALAEEILAQILNQEISFEVAAEQHTLDISTKGHGGKVAQGAWVQLSPNHPFTLAVKQLEVGEMSPKVNPGLNGFHIIRFDDIKEERPSADRYDREFKEGLAIDITFAEFLDSIATAQDIILEQSAETVD
ncbi:peptidylprolyl isomerase [Ignatzschineria sp. LJL83]